MPTDQLCVRPIAAGEDDAVIALWTACGLTRPWNDAAADLAFARAKPNSEVLVATLGGAIAASVMVGHDGHRGTMYYVSVRPDLQKSGIGRQLVLAAEAWLKERGVWKVNLLVRQGNEAVLAFYETLGYGPNTSQPIEKWIDTSKRGGG